MKAILLAAGIGSRLRPLTNLLPKCLMPIKGYPLMGYWIDQLEKIELDGILINLHHHRDLVQLFLDDIETKNKIKQFVEPELLGTAGTIVTNYEYLANSPALVIHADNLCVCDLQSFIFYHQNIRPKHCAITMMTFHTDTPQLAGIIEVDNNGIAFNMIEKSRDVKGSLANAAIYIFEPEVIDWLSQNPSINDISTQVLPHYMGRISTWLNTGIHLDIGNLTNLKKAQLININQNHRNVSSPQLNKKIVEIEEKLLKDICQD